MMSLASVAFRPSRSRAGRAKLRKSRSRDFSASEGRAGDKPWVHWRCPRPHHGPRSGHRSEKTVDGPRKLIVEPACSGGERRLAGGPPHAPHPRYSHPPPLLLHLLAHSPFPPVQLLVHACAVPAHSQADCRAPRAGAGPPQPTALAPVQRAVCDRFAQLQVRPRHPFAPSHACPAASAHPPLGECRSEYAR